MDTTLPPKAPQTVNTIPPSRVIRVKPASRPATWGDCADCQSLPGEKRSKIHWKEGKGFHCANGHDINIATARATKKTTVAVKPLNSWQKARQK